jgi:probable phosphoglycerate mutase
LKQIAILIRHGESESNTRGLISEDLEGFPLTETGRKQATRTAQELTKINVQRILSSPVLRTRETASIISTAINIQITIDHDIRESGLGPYNNKHFKLIPGGKREDFGFEPYDKIKERMMQSLRKYEDVNIFVSHELPIKAAISKILRLDEEESRGLKLGNASITVIDMKNEIILSIGSLELTQKVVYEINASDDL